MYVCDQVIIQTSDYVDHYGESPLQLFLNSSEKKKKKTEEKDGKEKKEEDGE